MTNEILRYVTAGLVNTVVGYAVFLVILHLAGAGALISNAISYVIGLMVAYVLNLAFVFRGARHSSKAIGRFLIGAGLAWCFNAIVLELGMRGLGLRPEWAQIPAMVAYTASFYLINRYFVWRTG